MLTIDIRNRIPWYLSGFMDLTSLFVGVVQFFSDRKNPVSLVTVLSGVDKVSRVDWLEGFVGGSAQEDRVDSFTVYYFLVEGSRPHSGEISLNYCEKFFDFLAVFPYTPSIQISIFGWRGLWKGELGLTWLVGICWSWRRRWNCHIQILIIRLGRLLEKFCRFWRWSLYSSGARIRRRWDSRSSSRWNRRDRRGLKGIKKLRKLQRILSSNLDSEKRIRPEKSSRASINLLLSSSQISKPSAFWPKIC